MTWNYDLDPKYAESALKRLYDKSTRMGECLEWGGGKIESGYGCISVGPRSYSVHRLAWILLKGPIPKGKLVCHSCDNRVCWEPSHLFLGDPKDNVMDMMAKGRYINVAYKLDVEQVREIYLLKGKEAPKVTADRYGVSRHHVQGIQCGYSWTEHTKDLAHLQLKQRRVGAKAKMRSIVAHMTDEDVQTILEFCEKRFGKLV